MSRPGTRLAVLFIWLSCACGGETAPAGRRTSPPAPGSQPGASTPTSTPGVSPGLIDNGANPLPLAGMSAPPPTQPGTPTGDPNVCEVVHLVANPQVPDMMIVLDRSGSMLEGGRWEPSVSAVRRVTMELQGKIRFGLALFPDPAGMMATMGGGFFGGGGDDGDSCAPGKVAVPIAENNATAIGQVLDRTEPAGGTPTADTLSGLLTTFAGMTRPDEDVHAKYVLLVTDGAPTCPAGGGASTTPEDVDASYYAVEDLLASQVRTYVIGYDTSGPDNAELATVLDGLAQRGGTGDQKHHPVEDEASLLATLQSITSQIASCSFQLDKAPPRPDFVLVTLDSKQVNLNDPNGWKLTGDRMVELTGASCDQLRNGMAHTLSAEVQCAVVAPM
jgi:hypothetical protein